ncbi:MAG: DUF2007 domain-containing protein [Maribacter sp.]
MNSAYIKVFGGNTIKAKRIELILKENAIDPIIKDESESARLAGFGTPQPEMVEIFVHQDQEGRALSLISGLDWEE